MSDYASQTMGATTSQLDLAGVVVAIGALGLAFLITTLFAILLVARSRRDLATLRALGAMSSGITRQLVWQLGLPAVVGLVLAVVLAATLGRLAFAAALGSLGAPGVVLMPNALVSYIALPLDMAAVVAAGIALALRRLRHVPTLTEE